MKLRAIEFMRRARREELSSQIIVLEELDKYINPPEANETLRYELLELLIRYIKTLPRNNMVVIPVYKISVNTVRHIIYISLRHGVKINLLTQGIDEIKTEKISSHLGLQPYKDLVIILI